MTSRQLIQFLIFVFVMAFQNEGWSASCNALFTDEIQSVEKFKKAVDQMQGMNPWTSKQFWRELEKITPIEVNQLLVNLYGGRFKVIADYSARIPEKFHVLMLEPGIANRLRELTRFLNKKNLSLETMDPFEAREKFSEFLGDSTLYRAITVAAEKKDSDQNLLASSFLNSSIEKMRETLRSFFDGDEANSLSKTIFLKLEGSSAGSTPVVSVTAYPELASAVAWDSRSPRNVENPVVLVYKLRIPEIQIIRKHRLFPMSKSERQSTVEIISSPRDIWEEYSFGDMGVEGLILFGLEKKWVESVRIEEQPAVYHIN